MASSSCGVLSAWLTRHCLFLGCTALLASIGLHGASRACATLEQATMQRVNAPQWSAEGYLPAAYAGSLRAPLVFLSPLEPDPPPKTEIERMLRPIQPMMIMSCES